MWNMLWPVLVVVLSNTLYNISAKSTPGSVNAFASLSATYLVAALASAGLFFLTSPQKNLALELHKANWTALALGAAIVGLEYGFLMVYRAGWKIGSAQLFTSVSVSLVLLLVGLLLYKEAVSPRQVAGMAVCMVGLVLMIKA